MFNMLSISLGVKHVKHGVAFEMTRIGYDEGFRVTLPLHST
jgi:hypothetical protein